MDPQKGKHGGHRFGDKEEYQVIYKTKKTSPKWSGSSWQQFSLKSIGNASPTEGEGSVDN